MVGKLGRIILWNSNTNVAVCMHTYVHTSLAPITTAFRNHGFGSRLTASSDNPKRANVGATGARSETSGVAIGRADTGMGMADTKAALFRSNARSRRASIRAGKFFRDAIALPADQQVIVPRRALSRQGVRRGPRPPDAIT